MTRLSATGADEATAQSLRRLLEEERLGGLVVTDLANVRRLCGFTGTSGLLAVFPEGNVFYTDSRYTLQAGEEVFGARVATVADPDRALAEEFAARGVGYLGAEAQGVTAARWRRWRRAWRDVCLVDLGDRLTRLRLIKTREELARLKAAALLAEEALRRAAALIRPGATERQVARAFQVEALALGAEGVSFDPIVAGGERGALPHATPSDREFRPGDLVVFDFGVRLDGYVSDQTVTLPVGEVEAQAREVYEVVLAAQRAALAAVKPGTPLRDVDRAARDVIADAGYGAFFGHGTGHGVGLEVHEAPTVSPRSADVAREGMVFTVEPGIYLPGKFGVRLEDTIAVTAGGWSPVTGLSKAFGKAL